MLKIKQIIRAMQMCLENAFDNRSFKHTYLDNRYVNEHNITDM